MTCARSLCSLRAPLTNQAASNSHIKPGSAFDAALAKRREKLDKGYEAEVIVPKEPCNWYAYCELKVKDRNRDTYRRTYYIHINDNQHIHASSKKKMLRQIFLLPVRNGVVRNGVDETVFFVRPCWCPWLVHTAA